MKKKISILLTFFVISMFPSICIAKIDKEIRESKKCTNLFPYFEKKYNLPKDSLHSISLHETSKKHSNYSLMIVWPWTVNVNGSGYHFKTREMAIKFTKQQLALGKSSIDVGCMQINLKYHGDAFASVEQAFSPRRNIAYGAKFLKSKYEALGDWHMAIGNYHSATKSLAMSYSQKVRHLAKNMEDHRSKLRHVLYSNKNTKYSNQDEIFAIKDQDDAGYIHINKIDQHKVKASNMFRRKIKRNNNNTSIAKNHHWWVRASHF